MKKLIAISVVFALLTGAAFAQVTFGAEVWAGTNLFHGNSEGKDNQGGVDGPFASRGFYDDDIWRGKLSSSYETDGGEAGVAVKIQWEPDDDKAGILYFDGAWWKPMDMLKISMGMAGFDRGDKLGWGGLRAVGFVQSGYDPTYNDDPTDAIYDPDDPSYGGSPFDPVKGGKSAKGDWKNYILYQRGSGNWLGITIEPMDMFSLNIAVIRDKWGPKLKGDGFVEGGDVKKYGAGNDLAAQFGDNIMIQALINVPNDMGQIGITYDNWVDDLVEHKKGDKVGGFFLDYSGVFGQLTADFGFSYYTGEFANPVKAGKWMSYWFMGLRVGYDVMDGFNAGFRFQTWTFNLMSLGVDFNYAMAMDPYTIGIKGNIMHHMGLGDYGKKDSRLWEKEKGGPKEGTSLTTYEFVPYLTSAIGGFTFTAELKIEGNTVKKSGVDYCLPIKFAYAW